jgi:hypothetical protein
MDIPMLHFLILKISSSEFYTLAGYSIAELTIDRYIVFELLKNVSQIICLGAYC